jgi:hypothetical protein
MPNVDVTEEFCGSPELFMSRNIVMQWIAKDKPGLIGVGVMEVEGATIDLRMPNCATSSVMT